MIVSHVHDSEVRLSAQEPHEPVKRRLCFAVLYRDVVTDRERLFEDALNQLAPLPQVLGPPILRRQRRNKGDERKCPQLLWCPILLVVRPRGFPWRIEI
jgi:hypothetical protein